jgi:tetratricopeptide (TPR) repeat protein
MSPKTTKPTRIADLLAKDPQTAADFSERGWLFYQQADYDRAANDFGLALDLEPDNADIQYAMGLALATGGHVPEATAAFEKALKLLDGLDDPVRQRMLKTITQGHINRLSTGDWHLTR